jgi:hypothetical protein
MARSYGNLYLNIGEEKTNGREIKNGKIWEI